MIKPFLSLVLFAALVSAPVVGYAATTTAAKPKVYKSKDISENPAVSAAQKVRDDAEKTLEDATDKNDKTAMESAKQALDAAEKKLTVARNAAEKAKPAKPAKTAK